MQPDPVKEIFSKLKLEFNRNNNYPYVEILNKLAKYGFQIPSDIDPITADSTILDKHINNKQFAEAFLSYIKTEYQHLHIFEEKFMKIANKVLWDKPVLKNMVDFVMYEMNKFNIRDFLWTHTDEYHRQVKERAKSIRKS